MPVTNYYTVNGEIIGEQTTGQVQFAEDTCMH
jgi:hypothetical protein